MKKYLFIIFLLIAILIVVYRFEAKNAAMVETIMVEVGKPISDQRVGEEWFVIVSSRNILGVQVTVIEDKQSLVRYVISSEGGIVQLKEKCW